MLARRLAATVLTTLVVAAVSVLLITSVIGHSEQNPYFDNPLRSESRDRLIICVAGASGHQESEQDRILIQEALEDGLRGVSEVPESVARGEVVLGCPPPPPELDDGDLTTEGLVEIAGGVPLGDKEPSPELLRVYFVPPEAFNLQGLDSAYFVINAEVECEGHSCLPVTFSMFVRSNVVPQALQQRLLQVVGLAAPEHGPMPDPVETP